MCFWFSLIVLRSTPLLQDLSKFVTPYYAAKWKSIGTYLGFLGGELDIIEHDYHNAERCCNEMWYMWLSKDNKATWKRVINSLDFSNIQGKWCTYIHACNTCVHARTRAHTHTYTHTYTHMYMHTHSFYYK